ncbi:chromobox protein homolog 1-like [Daphnia pulicaria]|uniref:chromobox protein homolog 1-like n=1 Tax=Daphnia pulicaria TaxID=35523 RepID=UPI001EEC7A8C|nr:chromobox protein homolog 1-like [Daphnia pulicaria]XP_046641439.1 chromobox protein homolog 1-like [Daphnia pulicaria]XP_046641440.1 chromobox protein homolog 1-like [Daphnia pulicaria]XP_046641441.1 chromobox protein homolog 1-like [Daphnia pulicaria]XP_046641442.1 chromobox protein homolog 1-like [Daphnia pulicaria]
MERTEKAIQDDDGTVGDATVENIPDQRERKSDGCVEYPLKQKDCNVEYNTKEPEKNFGCDLVLTFENITRKEEGGLKKRKVEKRKRSAALVVKEKIPASLGGFGRNLEPEKIVGATNRTGELQFLMKWKSIDDIDLVPAKEANKICPEIVIEFYEDRIKWGDEYVVEGRVL